MSKIKNRILIILLLGFFPGLYIIEWFWAPGGIKRVYYTQTYNKDKIRIIEDTDFLYYQKNYKNKYKLKSRYYVPHRILLIPDSKSVPVEYEFKGKLLVELYDKNAILIHSFEANQIRNILRRSEEDYYGNYLVYCGAQPSRASSTFAFEIGEIPFQLISLEWNKLNNMEMKITVIEPDLELQKYCESSTLVVIPNLFL